MDSLVSLSMIVRNEEELIERAIKSSNGLFDDICIVDTGSTDNTVPLCFELGANVIVGADRYHKGESRNKSIEGARGEWVVILDADEVLTDPIGLREFIKDTDADALYLNMTFVDDFGNPTLTYPIMRAFRKGVYLYKYRAHEVPIPVNGWGKFLFTDFVIEHRPPAERREWKPQYTLDRLLLDLKENPGDRRVLYYLGRQYLYCKKYKKSIETLNEYISLGGGIDSANAWFCIAQCYEALNDDTEMVSSLYKACQAQPTRRRWWGKLAEHYHAEGKDETAIALLNCAFSISSSRKTFALQRWYGAHIHDLAARCYWNLERIIEGRYHAQKALELDPNNERLQNNLKWFLPEKGRLAQLLKEIPELSRGKKRILYVGANRMRSEGMSFLSGFGHEITLLEIFSSNAEYYENDERLAHIVIGDVREIDLLELPHDHYDVVFWWHGPEHIHQEEVETTIKKIEAITNLVILATPNGYYRQDAIYGNANEEHRWSCLPENFEDWNYSTKTLGRLNEKGSHLLAWRQVD